ncbi:TIGR03619 family F420-dependent LLM class oxidoreductase [Anaerolinea sp.]|uniref:TIGR03619 family F420-dependent LLM class oxidoreductase n=1 Tax=Anaerolinea sp. TaxID=1872519 RepID=UPI002ACE679E|nr:TIGR03619 family F420-dependent LLM class oxidoreductase [Anaerolinea sp.]
MHFGVILPNYGAGSGRLAVLDTALAAEALGFPSVWTTDHLALPVGDAERFTPLLEALTTLAYLAGSTARVKLGVSALVLPQRNPLEVAREVATLDVLSGGRVMLAAGIGWSQGEYDNLGYSFTNRGKRMEEALQVLRTCWRGNRVVSYQGKYYRFEKVDFAPAPIQAGGPPLWVAGNSPAALSRALRLADGWHPVGLSPDVLAGQLARVRPLLANRPFTVAVRLSLAWERETAEGGALAGSPEQILEMLRLYQSSGATAFLLHFLAENQSERERVMRAFAREILPHFPRDVEMG